LKSELKSASGVEGRDELGDPMDVDAGGFCSQVLDVSSSGGMPEVTVLRKVRD
jgi:hypothetical protein